MSHANENSRPAAAERPTGLLRRILSGFLVRRLAAARRRRRRAELSRLSDHALKDIGLSRNDVAYIVRYGADQRSRAS